MVDTASETMFDGSGAYPMDEASDCPAVTIQSSNLPRASPLFELACFWYTMTQL